MALSTGCCTFDATLHNPPYLTQLSTPVPTVIAWTPTVTVTTTVDGDQVGICSMLDKERSRGAPATDTPAFEVLWPP